MKRLRIARRAVGDLDAIWDYSADTWGPTQANRYLDRLETAMNGLVNDATASRSADEVKAGLRRATVGQHAVYFRDHADRIDVIRVLHQRMDGERWV